MTDNAYRVTSAADKDGERAYVSAPATGDPTGTVAIVGAYKTGTVGPASFLDRADAVKLRDRLSELIEKHDAENPLYTAGTVVKTRGEYGIVCDDVPHGAGRATVRFASGAQLVAVSQMQRVEVSP